MIATSLSGWSLHFYHRQRTCSDACDVFMCIGVPTHLGTYVHRCTHLGTYVHRWVGTPMYICTYRCVMFAVPSLLVRRCRFVDILQEWAQTNQQLKEFARYTRVMSV